MHCCFEPIVETDLENGVHLSGIGGVGMSALAELLLDLNISVTGSDTTLSKNVLRLRARGVTIFLDQKKEHIGNRLVCRTRAVKDDNEEILFAKKSVFRRDLLAFLAKGKKQIVITGSHGKTTTSALLSHCMIVCGFDPSFAVGGLSTSLDRYGRVGKGEFFVIEGDESDGSHLITQPFAAILTSVDVDHLAFWKNGDNLLASYREFISKIKSKESFLYFGDDEVLASMHPSGKSYGFKKGSDFRVEITSLELNRTTFSINDTPFSLPMFGSYNCLNAAAVYGLLDSLGVSHQKIRESFSSFSGVMRRMEHVGYDIYSDYAHHPSEVRAVLRDLEGVHGDVQIIFEPHRLSRFKDELEGFCKVFKEIVITDIFEASEGLCIDPKPLLKMFCKQTNSIYVPLEEIETYLSEHKRKTLVIGAGPIDQVLRNYVNKRTDQDS